MTMVDECGAFRHGIAMTHAGWTTLSDTDLLPWRICDLGLRLEGSGLEALIAQFYAELEAKGLHFHPPCYLGDEWFVDEGVPAIAIPFYLAHPRLQELEAHMVADVEGGTATEFMKLIRHEAGHAFMYAYRLNRKRRFRELFGSSAEPYKLKYNPRHYSKRFVVHLDNWYAQSHPDEDFAESFAVWLTPHVNWRQTYKGWPALAKLEYIDSVMHDIATTPPPVTTRKRPYDASRLTRRLSTHYQRKKKDYATDLPDFYDADLRKLFGAVETSKSTDSASQFLRKHEKYLLRTVGRWTGVRKYTIGLLLQRIRKRCQTLKLGTNLPEQELLVGVTTYLTSLVVNFVHTGEFKRIAP